MRYLSGGILIAIFSLFFVLYKTPSALEVRCEAEVLHTIEEKSSKLTLDVTASLFLMKNGRGFVNLYGTFTDHQELWLVNRKLWLGWRNELNDNLYDIVIQRSDVKKETDKTPDALLDKIYSHHFNLELYRVGQNGLYLRGVSTPFFLCVRQNKIGKAA